MPRPRRNRNAALPGNGGREVIREEAVNTFLAQLLRDQGIAARAERRNRNATPDVRVTLKSGDTVLLECKWEDSASQLESQLDTRLQQFPDALGVIGVLYPEGLKYLDDTREGLENAGDLEWWVHGSNGEPIAEHPSRFGSPSDIADHRPHSSACGKTPPACCTRTAPPRPSPTPRRPIWNPPAPPWWRLTAGTSANWYPFPNPGS